MAHSKDYLERRVVVVRPKSQFSCARISNIWPGIGGKFRERTLAVLGVYSDESYDKRIFLVGGVIGLGKQIERLERTWEARIARENKRLASQGRPSITRYHAAELNALDGEFEGWSATESKAFSKALLRLLRKRGIYGVAYGVILKDIRIVFPEFIKTHNDAQDGAYQFATWKCLEFVHDQFGRHIPPEIRRTDGISFVYERSRFARFAHAAYDMIRDGPNYKYREAFNSIAEGGHESHIALQAGDLIAYECFRELSRHVYRTSNPRRTFFKKMIRNSGVWVFIAYAGEKYLRELKAGFGDIA